jgi:hypothetical protein
MQQERISPITQAVTGNMPFPMPAIPPSQSNKMPPFKKMNGMASAITCQHGKMQKNQSAMTTSPSTMTDGFTTHTESAIYTNINLSMTTEMK